MRLLFALLLLATVAAASLTPALALLAVVAAWLALDGLLLDGLLLDGLLLIALNAWRGRLERLPEEPVATIYERAGKLVMRRSAAHPAPQGEGE